MRTEAALQEIDKAIHNMLEELKEETKVTDVTCSKRPIHQHLIQLQHLI